MILADEGEFIMDKNKDEWKWKFKKERKSQGKMNKKEL